MRTQIIHGVPVRLKKESRLMRFFGWVSNPFNPTFMTRYWTTWFGVVYAPDYVNLDASDTWDRYATILNHEAIHIADFEKYHIWMLLTYIFPPTILAYGRWYWERKAYLPELQALSGSPYFITRLNHIVDNLGGSDYFWTWPKGWMRKWFLKNLEKK